MADTTVNDTTPATTTDEGTDLLDSAKSLFEQAQETITDAVESAVQAAKENPVAAAAIAAGTVAAVGAAAYGISQLVGGDDEGAAKKK